MVKEKKKKTNILFFKKEEIKLQNVLRFTIYANASNN